MCEHDEPIAGDDADVEAQPEFAHAEVVDEPPPEATEEIRFGSSSYGTDEWGNDVYWSNSEQSYYKEDDWETVDPWDKDVKWS